MGEVVVRQHEILESPLAADQAGPEWEIPVRRRCQ